MRQSHHDLRAEAHEAPLSAVRGLVGGAGFFLFCIGIAGIIKDALDPTPLLDWRVGVGVCLGGLMLMVAGSILMRRHSLRLAVVAGLSPRKADAIWKEDAE